MRHRDRSGRLLGSLDRLRLQGHDDVYVAVDEIGRKRREPLSLPIRPPPLDGEVLTFDVTEVTQPLSKRLGVTDDNRY